MREAVVSQWDGRRLVEMVPTGMSGKEFVLRLPGVCVQPQSCSFACTAKEGMRKPRLFSAPAAQRVVGAEWRQSTVTEGTLSSGTHP